MTTACPHPTDAATPELGAVSACLTGTNRIALAAAAGALATTADALTERRMR